MKNGTELKARDIVVREGVLGRVIEGYSGKGEGKFLFLPANYGTYDQDELETVTADDVEETTVKEKIDYLMEDFTWGVVNHTEIINRGEYVIFKYIEKGKNKAEGKTMYAMYLNFESTGVIAPSLDTALISLLVRKYQGVNSQAGLMFERMLEMKPQ